MNQLASRWGMEVDDACEHFNPHFITTVLFKEKGEETEIGWSLLFDTTEICETVIKVHKADKKLAKR